jgi:hypothetical protein
VLGFNEFFSVHAAKGLGAAPISNLIGTSAARVERPISFNISGWTDICMCRWNPVRQQAGYQEHAEQFISIIVSEIKIRPTISVLPQEEPAISSPSVRT